MSDALYAIRWSRPDPVKGRAYGLRVVGRPPVPEEPILIDDEDDARNLAAYLNEQGSGTYEYRPERVK